MPYLADANFLKEHKIIVNTEDIIAPAPAKFLRQVDNNFAITPMKQKLTDIQYEQRKEVFMKSADMKLILLYLNIATPKSVNLFGENENLIVIITEETAGENDGKLFYKIPKISAQCKFPVEW